MNDITVSAALKKTLPLFFLFHSTVNKHTFRFRVFHTFREQVKFRRNVICLDLGRSVLLE